jgi:hypothetical protein
VREAKQLAAATASGGQRGSGEEGGRHTAGSERGSRGEEIERGGRRGCGQRAKEWDGGRTELENEKGYGGNWKRGRRLGGGVKKTRRRFGGALEPRAFPGGLDGLPAGPWLGLAGWELLPFYFY